MPQTTMYYSVYPYIMGYRHSHATNHDVLLLTCHKPQCATTYMPQTTVCHYSHATNHTLLTACIKTSSKLNSKGSAKACWIEVSVLLIGHTNPIHYWPQSLKLMVVRPQILFHCAREHPFSNAPPALAPPPSPSPLGLPPHQHHHHHC